MSSIELREFEPSLSGQWNEFVEKSNNGTMFHHLDFLAYHPPNRFQFNHLMFYKKDKLVAVLPGGIAGEEYRSPLGASYGGFAFVRGTGLRDACEIVQAHIDWCRRQHCSAIQITPPMSIYQTAYDEVFDNALIYNGFSFHNPLYSSVIDLSVVRGRDDLGKTPRYCVALAEREGVTIREDDDYDMAYAMLLTNKEKFKAKPTHTLDELERLRKLLPGRLVLFVARYRGEPIAGQWLFRASRTCALIFYSMHHYEYRKLCAVNYLVAYATRWCVDNGYRYLDFGVSPDTFSTNPLEPSWPLVKFKESMGSTGCLRKAYRLNLA